MTASVRRVDTALGALAVHERGAGIPLIFWHPLFVDHRVFSAQIRGALARVSGRPLLRDKLVAVALTSSSVRESRLSLRTIAQMAGVSRQAPYLCFDDKRAMLAVVAAEVTRRSRTAWEKALVRAADEPRARLSSVAVAPVRYARAHPALHSLVYGSYVRKADNAELQREGVLSLALLRDLVAAVQPTSVSVVEIRRRTMVLWGVTQRAAEVLQMRERGPSRSAAVPPGRGTMAVGERFCLAVLKPADCPRRSRRGLGVRHWRHT